MLIKFLKPDFEFEDERGKLLQLIHDGYKQVNVIFCKADTFRGGHFHKENIEAFFVISGSFQLKVEKDSNIEEYNIKANDFFEIQPFVKHSFTYNEDTVLVSMYNNGVELLNGEKDIYTI